MPKDLTASHEAAHTKARSGSGLTMHASSFGLLFIMLLVFSTFLETTNQLSASKSPYQSNITRLQHQKFKIYDSQQPTNTLLKNHPSIQTLRHTSSTPTSPRRRQKVRHQSRKTNTTTASLHSKDLTNLFRDSFMGLIGSEDALISTHTGQDRVPAYIMDLYRQSQTRKAWRRNHRHFEYGWFSGDTIRSFLPEAQQRLTSRYSGRKVVGEKYIFKFNTSHLPENERCKGSELRVFYSPPPLHRHFNSHRSHKFLYALERMYVYFVDTSTHRHTLLDKKTFKKWLPQWLTLNVSRVLGHFTDRTELTFKVVLSSGHKHRHKRSTLSSSPSQPASLSINDNSHTPLLVTYSESTSSQQNHKRQRRRKKWTKPYNSPSHRQSAKRRQHNMCRRRRFYVGFEMLGWNDWILAPSGYEAYFCQGHCPTFMPDYLNATNHAIIQSLMHSRNPKNVPRPCCVPTRLEALTLLYFHQRKGYIIKEYPNMVVLGCGCR